MTKNKNGVTYIFDGIKVTNIIVEDTVKSIEIDNDIVIDGNNIKQSYPNVENLIIRENVKDIQIPNQLFPNIKKIISNNNTLFPSGSMLIKCYRESTWLLNTFCQDENSVIDLSGINVIESNAFSGCRSVKLINDNNLKMVNNKAFDDSAIMEQCMKGNSYMKIGNFTILFGLDIDYIDFPPNGYLLYNNCQHIKTVVVHTLGDIILFTYIKIDNLIVDANFFEISSRALSYYFQCAFAKNITLCDNQFFASVDGVIYSKNMKHLCMMPKDRTGEYNILPGTVAIESGAFAKSKIHKVICPDSLEMIRMAAFEYSGVKEIVLNEGLKIIESNAFCRCPIKKIVIPESVISIGAHNFTMATDITLNGHDEMFLRFFTDEYYADNTMSIVFNKTEYILPKHMSNENADKIETFIVSGCKVPDFLILNSTISTKVKHELAVMLYKQELEAGIIDENVKKYLKRTIKSIACDAIKNNPEMLKDILDFKLIDKTGLEYLLDVADSCKKITEKAYIVNAIKNLSSKTSSFKL